MLETLTNCPLCYSGQFSKYITCKDHTVSQESFDISQCDSCGFLFTNPRPKPEDLGNYYESQDYISHTNKSNNPINIIYKIARKFTLKGKIDLINTLSSKGNILDIGCGTGHFLSACQKNGWNITGVEPDKNARSIAKDNTGKDIYEKLPDVKSQTFDIITMWHVLEHVPNLNEYIQWLTERLKDDGKLIVAVPNHKSYDAHKYREHWAAYDVPRHLYHFDQESMSQLMAKYDFKVDAVLPMPLDAYYVSMLSEKYKQPGIFNYIKAVLTGMKSNRSADNNNTNYSSLIYIISR